MINISCRRILTRKLFVATLLCVVTFAVSGAAAAFKNIKVGDQALPVELKDLEGRDHSLEQYGEARAVLVLFWATWSERSMRELEDLRKFKDEYGDEGLQILAVNVEKQNPGDEDMRRIQSALVDREIDFPVLIDDGLKTYSEWGVIATPTTALLGEQGRIVFELSSYPTSGFMDMDEAIRKVLDLYVEKETAVSDRTGYKPARNAILHLGLGKRHVEKGFLTKALPEFQKAAEADPGWADPLIYMGYLYVKQGQEDRAVESIEKAEELEPERDEVLWLRSYLLLAEQKVDEALALLQSNRFDEFGGPAAGPGSSIMGTGPVEEADTEETPATEAVPAAVDGLEGVRELVEEKRMEEASTRLADILDGRLAESGFPMKRKKTLNAMEKMKLMMEKKQEKQ